MNLCSFYLYLVSDELAWLGQTPEMRNRYVLMVHTIPKTSTAQVWLYQHLFANSVDALASFAVNYLVSLELP